MRHISYSILRLTGCNVAYTDESGSTHYVHPVHAYNDNTVCFDNSRLMFQQTEFTPNVAFTMRTFRFNINGEDSNDVQQQTITCSMHLIPSADLVQDQAADCTCYDEASCTTPTGPFGSGKSL